MGEVHKFEVKTIGDFYVLGYEIKTSLQKIGSHVFDKQVKRLHDCFPAITQYIGVIKNFNPVTEKFNYIFGIVLDGCSMDFCEEFNIYQIPKMKSLEVEIIGKGDLHADAFRIAHEIARKEKYQINYQIRTFIETFYNCGCLDKLTYYLPIL